MMARERHDHRVHAHERADEKEEWAGPTWTVAEVEAYVERNGACVMLIDGYIVDVTGYVKTHVRSLSLFHLLLKCGVCSLTGSCMQPGGAGLLHEYAIPVKADRGCSKWKEADWAFNGGVNKHSQVARWRMRQFRVALLDVSGEAPKQ